MSLYFSFMKFFLYNSLRAGEGILPWGLVSAPEVAVFVGLLSKPWEGNFSLGALYLPWGYGSFLGALAQPLGSSPLRALSQPVRGSPWCLTQH